MKKKVKTYRGRPGSGITDEKAKIYGPELERLQSEYGKHFCPEVVVQEAKNKKSVFHGEFNWNVEEAAHQHWLGQARRLIGGVMVRFNREDVRLFYNVNVEVKPAQGGNDPEFKRTYASLDDVQNDEKLRWQIVLKAYKEFQSWLKRYKTYKEFGPLSDAAKQVELNLGIE